MISAFLFLAARPDPVMNWFDVTRSAFAIYNIKDTARRGMDCLKVVGSSDGRKFYGVYHSMQDDVFHLWLAESSDAKIWKPVRKLDIHAHQGTIYISPQGKVVLAWEKDIPGKGNHIHVACFRSEADMELDNPIEEKDIDRSFSPSAEGTPSFDEVDWRSKLPKITLGFHYWRNSDVDRQAVGKLDANWNWTCEKRPAFDEFVEKFGVRGNIGDRDAFTFKDDYTILEGMQTKDDWASWRVYLVNRSKNLCELIDVKTPKGSKSFANPNITIVKDKAFITFFMPSQGNDPSEAGELLYAVDLKK